jgi:hypothetical protein
MIPVFERTKKFNALHGAVTVIGKEGRCSIELFIPFLVRCIGMIGQDFPAAVCTRLIVGQF